MEILYILLIPVVFAIVIIIAGAILLHRKSLPKPLINFTVDEIIATIYFKDGDSLVKKFVGSVNVVTDIVYNRVFRRHAHYTAQDQLLDWLKKNNNSGFIFVDDDTMLPIEKVIQIGLERTSKVIEVPGL